MIFDENLIEIAKKNGIPVKRTANGFAVDERGARMLATLQAGNTQQDPRKRMNQRTLRAINGYGNIT